MVMTAYDVAYSLGLVLGAPYWLLRPSVRKKVLEAFALRMGRERGRQSSHPAVMIHAVSVGELNATTAMVRMLADARPELSFIISTTTSKGWERAEQLYGTDPKVTLVRYPLDFSGAVQRMLSAQRPSAVVLMELEVWPNFMRACAAQEIPVIVANGRLTPGSFKNYRLGALVTRPMFARLSFVGAQEDNYAQRFITLGVPADRVQTTGVMKFDTAQVAARIAGSDELASNVGLKPGERIWVCGSTGPGEERIILDAYRKLLATHSDLRLVIVPRKPERFDEVAQLIRDSGFALVRRSQTRESKSAIPNVNPSSETDARAVILGDTMGELRAFYSLATVVFVGRTLVDLGHSQHGSDMIEPAALAKPVIAGPYTSNFAETMNRFREASAMREVFPSHETSATEVLRSAVDELLISPDAGAEMGRRAQEVVRQNQGATARNVEAILTFLPAKRAVTSHEPLVRQI
jgi:3-deoxy-D-manno-octulosonic-acid transferase